MNTRSYLAGLQGDVLGILMNDPDFLWRVAKYVTFKFCLSGNLCLDKNSEVGCAVIVTIYCYEIWETIINLVKWANK